MTSTVVCPKCGDSWEVDDMAYPESGEKLCDICDPETWADLFDWDHWSDGDDDWEREAWNESLQPDGHP